jgi:type I restriction enzyme M protein
MLEWMPWLAFDDHRNEYRDVPGVCRAATLGDIEKQSWSLNPGRYVGVTATADDGVDFRLRIEDLTEELVRLNGEAVVLQERIAANVAELLD